MARYFINLFRLRRLVRMLSFAERTQINPPMEQKNRSKGRATQATTIYLLTDKDGTHTFREAKA
jgi:hypothetical protein